jgi:hypothetical protein
MACQVSGARLSSLRTKSDLQPIDPVLLLVIYTLLLLQTQQISFVWMIV